MVTRAFSTEDGNLNARSIITTRNKLFSDIDLTFAKRPSGDVYKKTVTVEFQVVNTQEVVIFQTTLTRLR